MIPARLLRQLLRTRSKKIPSHKMPGFDREFYLANNPDVAANGVDPLKHYLEHGWREGREPSGGFTGQRYLALNPDVQADGLNPLVHYLRHGLAEGRPGARAEPAPVAAPPAEALQAVPSSSPVEHRREPTRLL